ncbi:MAG: ATP-binding cassette domain-containing protein [Acidobacteria bacterium]|nr:ATP-binding cassette domain-containing protein [Acidobacteriota bacterium]MBI3658796.1 ATP-binding cassette domain-containing protein [Acidobacteriota bacterium]
MSFISMVGATKQYGAVYALKRLSLEIRKGEWLAIMGPSGSGKSTLVNLIGCLDKPTEGTVMVDGVALTQLTPKQATAFRRETIGLIFQQYHLIPYLTVLENVMLAQYFHSMTNESEAKEALESVGLTHRLTHLPSQLSGGEQQRVCIARAIINEPPIILADEPTGNLDEQNETIVMEIFDKLHAQGRTIILVTHDPEIGRHADRRIELHHGLLTDVTLTGEQQDELHDDILEKIWLVIERGKTPAADLIRVPDVIDNRRRLRTMMEGGWIVLSNGEVVVTEKGKRRAEDIVRRHRLAERLLADTLAVGQKEAAQQACRFEHILSPETTEKICSFLQHPRTCPHGMPIPRGRCCTC